MTKMIDVGRMETEGRGWIIADEDCEDGDYGEDGDCVYPRLLERGKDEERLCHLHAIESGSDIWTDSWIGSYMGVLTTEIEFVKAHNLLRADRVSALRILIRTIRK